MKKPKVLVAGTAPAIETVQELLGSEVDTVAARSMREALRHLQADPDLIMCNVRFDESRMLELLQVVKASAPTRDKPFVCFRLTPAPPAWEHDIEVAVLAIGGTAFVDLSSLERRRGHDAAVRQLRDIVLSHLPH